MWAVHLPEYRINFKLSCRTYRVYFNYTNVFRSVFFFCFAFARAPYKDMQQNKIFHGGPFNFMCDKNIPFMSYVYIFFILQTVTWGAHLGCWVPKIIGCRIKNNWVFGKGRLNIPAFSNVRENIPIFIGAILDF